MNLSDRKPETLATAPHLVWLDEIEVSSFGREIKDVVPALPELLPDGAEAVFWRCRSGADELFRHLRGPNMVLIPSAAAGVDFDGPTDGGDRSHSMVLFRHADANVMAQVCPALDLPELRRLLGPADLLFSRPSWEWYPVDGIFRQH